MLRLNEIDINESPVENKGGLIDESLRYISKILQLSEKWFDNHVDKTLKTELEWLIQSSWNQAVEAEKFNLDLSTCLLFEQTAKLIALCNEKYIENLYICYYFSIKYRIKMVTENKSLLTEYLEIAKKSFESLFSLIPSLELESVTLTDLKSFLILSNFEMLLLNENWQDLSKMLDSPDFAAYPVSLLKSIAGNLIRLIQR